MLVPPQALRDVLVGLVVVAVGGLAVEGCLGARVAAESGRMTSIAAELAASIDAEEHESIEADEDVGGEAFRHIRAQLQEAHDRHHLRSPIYTLRPVVTDTGDRATIFVVMTNPTPYFGHGYTLTADMVPVLREGEAAGTGLYRSPNGWWVSGLAPIEDAAGDVVALVSCDRPSEDLLLRRVQGWLLALALGLVAVLGVRLVPALLSTRVRGGRSLQQLVFGSLAHRIGLAGGLTVLASVTLLSVLDHFSDRQTVVQGLEERLRTAVSVGALQVDGELHQRVAASGDATTEDFAALRTSLRRVQEAAGLETPVYTLAREGDRTRFVGMTQEVPFLGEYYELRPGVKATFEGGGPGVEGPYADAHGQWVSAWAPVVGPGGEVVAVLQADLPVEAFVMAVQARDMKRALLALAAALMGLVVSSLLARGIARPVGEVARAAARIQEGDFEISLPEDRLDEVGQLMAAVQRMARGLREKELLRTMFGKYMATQVATELLASGAVELSGEEREVTVLLTDIRGYTALTESLGAADVVGLLNEYFAILVDVVLEHDGVIDKFMGDALLCWFGAPRPQADHRDAAVKAAMEIQQRTAAWNQARVAAGEPAVATGIGLADGTVVMGSIGSPQRLEYTAIGDAVNLASRLCGLAEPGEILVTSGVWAGSGAYAVDFTDIGLIDVKGVREPVAVRSAKLPVVAA